METKTSLIWSDSRVELYSVTCVCLNFTVVVNPSNLECKDTLRLYDTLNDLSLLKLRVLVVYLLDRLQYFVYCLEVLFLIRILGLKLGHQFLCVHFVVLFVIGYYLFHFPSASAAEQIVYALDL